MNPAFSGWRGYTLVEPPMLLFFFGQTVTGVVTHQLLMERSCQAVTESDDVNCYGTEDVSKMIRYVSDLLMYKSFVDGLVPAILSIFLGPWSDRHGRKPLLVAAYAGSATSFLLWAILSTRENLNPWLFLIASVPPALVGGYYSLSLASYCYIADIRPASDRAWHMSWLQSAAPIGQLVGMFAGLHIYLKFGFAATFGTASAANAIATLYVLFYVPESVTHTDASRTMHERSGRSLFDFSLIKELILTCTRKREGFDRVLIWCCVCVLALNMLIGEGELNIGFMFAGTRFNWSLKDYTMFSIVVLVLSIVGTLLGGRIFKCLIDKTMSSMLIAILANLSAFAGSMAKAFARESWHFSVSSIFGMLGGLSGPVVRTALSKSAPPNEIGKVFSLTAAMEALIPLAASPIYTQVNAHYMPPVYPSPVYLISAGLYVFIMILVTTIDRRISGLSKNRPITVIN